MPFWAIVAGCLDAGGSVFRVQMVEDFCRDAAGLRRSWSAAQVRDAAAMAGLDGAL
eukprot:SAG22_NODE_5858_length_941_cov_1.587886_2_plen_55_part_01